MEKREQPVNGSITLWMPKTVLPTHILNLLLILGCIGGALAEDDAIAENLAKVALNGTAERVAKELAGLALALRIKIGSHHSKCLRRMRGGRGPGGGLRTDLPRCMLLKLKNKQTPAFRPSDCDLRPNVFRLLGHVNSSRGR